MLLVCIIYQLCCTCAHACAAAVARQVINILAFMRLRCCSERHACVCIEMASIACDMCTAAGGQRQTLNANNNVITTAHEGLKSLTSSLSVKTAQWVAFSPALLVLGSGRYFCSAVLWHRDNEMATLPHCWHKARVLHVLRCYARCPLWPFAFHSVLEQCPYNRHSVQLVAVGGRGWGCNAFL
jgi:hypothetical protein